MRILLDQGVKGMRNKGNIALLQVAMKRFSEMWPTASIEVLTDAPYLMRLYCPSVQPVSPDDSCDWTTCSSRFRKLVQQLPVPALRLLFEAREEMWRWPGIPKKCLPADGNRP